MLTSILLASALSSSVPIHVGRFDEADFPNAQKVARRMPQAELTHRVDQILASRRCELPGQTKSRYNIAVPYAVLMQPTGSISRVVVKEIGCAPIESLVGQVAIKLSKAGDFRPSHQQGERWYVSELYFARGGEEMASLDDDQDKIICRAAEAVTGSRLSKKKVCRTVSEWRLYTLDRDQRQRDLLHKGLDVQPRS